MLFFSTALKSDNHRSGVTKDAANLGKRNEAWEPIEIRESLEIGHRQSMTGFSLKEKQDSPRKQGDSERHRTKSTH
jgi:hypothetical protein